MAKLHRQPSRKNYADITTRLPAPVMADLKHRLAPRFGGTLMSLYDVLIRNFLHEAPWALGLKWRETQALSRREETIVVVKTDDGSPLETAVTNTVATGWIQVNMRIPEDLALRVKSVAGNNGVSPSTVLFTAVYYFVWYKNPTPAIKKIREARKQQYEERERRRGEDPESLGK